MTRSRRCRRNDNQWSELPPELLSSIADRLKNSSDVQQFRGVCKSWESAVNPPLLRLSPLSDAIHSYISNHRKELRHRCIRVPIPTAVYLLRPRQRDNGCSWLVGVDQITSGKVRLVHLLTKLPYEAIPENFPRTFSNEVAQEIITTGFDYRHVDHMKRVLRLPGVGEHIEYANATDTRHGYPHQLFVNGFRAKIEDIILWNCVVWVVDCKGRLYELDYVTMGINTVTATANFVETGKFGNKRLLEYQGELYMVVMRCKTMCHTTAFLKVYKLDEKFRMWEYVENFDDRVLLLSGDTCFFAPAVSNLKSYRNCSIFPVDTIRNEKEFELGMCRYGVGANFTRISSYSDNSDLFWPPPKWIMELSSSKP